LFVRFLLPGLGLAARPSLTEESSGFNPPRVQEKRNQHPNTNIDFKNQFAIL